MRDRSYLLWLKLCQIIITKSLKRLDLLEMEHNRTFVFAFNILFASVCEVYLAVYTLFDNCSPYNNLVNNKVVLLSLQSYDRQHKNRKCLLVHKSKTDTHGDDSQYMMVEPPPFDIYLCDNCDAELYSKEAIFVSKKIFQIVAMVH